MKKGILFISVFISIFIINYIEHYIVVKRENLIGTYNFFYKLESYQIQLLKNEKIIFIEKKNTNQVKEISGQWNIKLIGNTPYLEVDIDKMDNIDFNFGKIEFNLFTQKIKIEALSIGKFYGEEDNAFFIKEYNFN